MYIDTFTKEAEMVLSRILGTGMILLFSLRFLINKASRVKAAGHFNNFFAVSCSFLGFHRHTISTLRGIRVCDYLFFEQFTTATYYSWLPINHNETIRIGGGIE
jgi:hypothetical protein